ncbi:Alpha-tectorin [Dissostichus eleginoides]|uniref:Alpha-tectorin n=1 Tax=Dissostichus eleginoides TaxID=100907 RepID=A0AAD9B628_DISEL|nr:Alpha-tectorin [Dissostichus eleginoides]
MINLEQGGRVLVDEQILTLSSIAHQHNGVEFSVDQNIVTVELPSYNMTILFDGNTAHVAGQIEAMEGLCGSPSDSTKTTSLAAEKSSTPASLGTSYCEIQHTDTVDNSIHCSLATDHCNLLRQAPFSACHNHTDPEPFITACTETLCNYRLVDGVDCQFMEAYAQSCSLKADITLEDWRSTTTCSGVPVCQQLCSEHEFCGEKNGRGLCLCRGEPAVCREESASVTLAGCLLADKGIDYSVLHLNDPNCKGQMDNETHMVTFGFDSSNICGTEVVKNNSMILYKNAIMTRNMSEYGVITRHVQIDFSCLYKEPEIKSFAFRIKDSSVVQELTSGEWNYTLQMSAYLDQNLLYVVKPETELLLNQRIWLELKTEGLDGNRVSIVTDSCWATSQSSPNDILRYDLINSGCPNANDETVRLSGNGQGTSNMFSFNMFEFNGGNREIFLHCKLELCVRMGNSCQPTCTPRSRRRRRASKYVDKNPAIISMSWTK